MKIKGFALAGTTAVLFAAVLSLPKPASRAASGGRGATVAAPKLDAEDQRVTNALTQALRSRVSSPGGALNLVVKPSARASQGEFSEVYIAGRPAQVRRLRISELSLRARNVRIDVPYLLREKKVRTLSSKTTLRAVVTENDITRLLAGGKHTQGLGLRVKYLSDNTMLVTGRLNWTLINGPIRGTARLRMMPNYKVNLDILSLQLRGREVPQFVKNQFSQKINPVIDYEDIPFRPRFRGLQVSGSRAVLTA
ncbi:MAG: hypothetical protein JWN98_759 [Abditibacteriota bacterium]|nr:hypothetical protein [Abditibacteriota bacterium]